MLFPIGTKVRCVGGFVPPGRQVKVPRIGKVYTVRDYVTGQEDGHLHNVYLRFKEIRNRPGLYGVLGEFSFESGAFEAVDQRPTDISVLKQIDADAFAGVKHPIEPTGRADLLLKVATRTRVAKHQPPVHLRDPRPHPLIRGVVSTLAFGLCVFLVLNALRVLFSLFFG